MKNFCSLIRADGVHLVVFDPNKDEFNFSVQYGGDHIDLNQYSEYAFELHDDKRYVLASENPFKALHCGMIAPQPEFRNSPIIRDFFEPHGVFYHLFCMMPYREDGTMVNIAAWRDRDKDPFSNIECEMLGELTPHLTRVVELQRSLVEAEIVSNPAVRILDAIPIGVILCDAAAHSIFMNSAAKRIIENNDGLNNRHGELWAESPDVTKMLRDNIRRAVASYGAAETVPASTMSIKKMSGGSDLLAMVSAVAGSTPVKKIDMFQRPVAVVYLSDPDIRQETPQGILQRLFGLTLAESRLLQSLIQTGSLKAAARENNITEGTARSYLKRIFSKTGVKSQIELVRLASNSPAWLRNQAADPFESSFGG